MCNMLSERRVMYVDIDQYNQKKHDPFFSVCIGLYYSESYKSVCVCVCVYKPVYAFY